APLEHRACESAGVERCARRRRAAPGEGPTPAHDRCARALVPRRGRARPPAVGRAREGRGAGAVRAVRGLPAERRRDAQRRRHARSARGRRMNWPTMSDYQEAIQNPGNCFSDPQLKAGTPALNALGLPQPVTGGFCSVYQVASGKTKWAVRCFLHNIQDLRERYKEISKYLRWHKVKQTVGFEYLQEGIRVRDAWHPVLKMEGVDGDTLDRWVDKHVDDPGALRRLADRWGEVMKGLEAAHVGHCDLQHGNV